MRNRKSYHAAYYVANRERYATRYAANRELRWEQGIIRRFGPDAVAFYWDRYKRQAGLCAICGKPETSLRCEHLSIDHDHHTGRLRGLLCNACNKALGALDDSIPTLESAIRYLQRN